MARLKVIACDIMRHELEAIAPRSPNTLDILYLSREGYHNEPDKNRPLLQSYIDSVPEGYDAILLGFAFCNRLLDGIEARHTRLVIPRAHDCITFFMGSRERYREYFSGHPGTYYYTAGWLERRDGEQLIQAQSVSNALGLAGQTYEEMVETYGEENAQYLMEFFGGWKQHYTHGILIDFPFAEALNLKEQVQAICRENGWQYGEIPGDLSLLERFIGGDWNDDFLVVPPGQSIRATYDECVMKASETGADSPSSDGAIAIKI